MVREERASGQAPLEWRCCPWSFPGVPETMVGVAPRVAGSRLGAYGKGQWPGVTAPALHALARGEGPVLGMGLLWRRDCFGEGSALDKGLNWRGE